MSFLFTLEEGRLSEQLPALFERYEGHVADAAPMFELRGERLEPLMRDLPGRQTFYAHRANEVRQVIKWLENYRAKLESRYTKNYSQGQRALGSREASIFINGEGEIVELNQLIIEASLLYGQLDAIVEGFKQMAWSLSNVTKLRVAELQEAVV